MPTEACLEEFEALTAIFLDEIEIGEEDENGSTTVSMVLYPATGDDQESKYVTLTLELNLPTVYPKVSPIIRFRNPRGLSESLLNSLYNEMVQCCSERLESQMIFELIDMVKEFLTLNNRPASECPICLHSFTTCDKFFRSQCFHHFHSNCLGRYLQNLMQVIASDEHLPGDAPEMTCPVCREKLDEDIDVEKLLSSPPPFEETLDNVEGDAVLKKWQGQMEELKTLFDKQKSQGGIIDLSENDKKRLVISSPRQTGDGGGDSPSSSSEVSSTADGELVLVPPPRADDIAGATQIPMGRNNPRSETRTKAVVKESTKENKCSTNSTGSQNGQVKSSSMVAPPPKSAPQSQKESEASDGKTSPTVGRHAGRHHGHHGRGKGGYYGHGNGRRRYK